ncbi:fer3-like protein [Paramacrobiotus metropolitanus]|uniref:fer3-like protein n=1 Tax=Paramacrobiotus metropolitanus TaxID=2943436 RepID=UPI002446135F|nr:fer3-like protein [Paramacrobiotus metropolitanus]
MSCKWNDHPVSNKDNFQVVSQRPQSALGPTLTLNAIGLPETHSWLEKVCAEKSTTTAEKVKKPVPKRKRINNASQRMAANYRERKRMVNLNAAFSRLQHHLPVKYTGKRLSRIQTLRLAISYIFLLTQQTELMKKH